MDMLLLSCSYFVVFCEVPKCGYTSVSFFQDVSKKYFKVLFPCLCCIYIPKYKPIIYVYNNRQRNYHI